MQPLSQSPKVKALLCKAFTFGRLKFVSLTRTYVCLARILFLGGDVKGRGDLVSKVR